MLSSSNSVAFADSVAQKRRLQQSENDRIHYCTVPVPSAFSCQAQLYPTSSTAATTSCNTALLQPATSNVCTNGSKPTSSSAFPSMPQCLEFRAQQVPCKAVAKNTKEGGERGENNTARDVSEEEEEERIINYAKEEEDGTLTQAPNSIVSVGIEEARVLHEGSFGDKSTDGGLGIGVLVHVAEMLEGKAAPLPSTRRLNPEAKAFVPAIGGFSYFDQYESTQQTPSQTQRQKSNHSETPESPQGYRHRNTAATSGTVGAHLAADNGGHSQSVMRPDFGRVVVGNHLTVEQGAQTLVEAGQDDHEHHQALDELSSQYSRGTSTRYTTRQQREGGEDGQEAPSDYNYDDDEAEYLTNYEEYEENDAYYDDDDDMGEEDHYGDDALTEEERAWLEAQCEAKDNPPDWFW